MGFFEWWAGLPAIFRYGVAIAFLAVSTLLWFVGGRFWPWGWAIGGALLLLSGKSDSEKRGYNF